MARAPATDSTSSNATLRQARALVSLERSKSIHVTARELGVAPSTVHHRLERFADALGLGPLITGSVKGNVDLSADGRGVLPLAQALVDAYDRLHMVGHTIRVTCYPILAGRAAETVIGFTQAHRRERIEAVFYGISDELRRDRAADAVARTAAGEIDICIAPASNVGRGLASEHLYSWTLRAVMSDGHRLRGKPNVTLEELARNRVLVAPRGHLSRQLFEAELVVARRFPPVAMELANQQVLAQIARAGPDYVAIIPDDAFGESDDSLGPAVVNRDRQTIGGSYAIFYSQRHPTDAEAGSARSRAVLELVAQLRNELGDELPREALLRDVPRKPR